MKNNFTPGHFLFLFTAAISNIKYARASLNKWLLLRSYPQSANKWFPVAHYKNPYFFFDMELKGRSLA